MPDPGRILSSVRWLVWIAAPLAVSCAFAQAGPGAAAPQATTPDSVQSLPGQREAPSAFELSAPAGERRWGLAPIRWGGALSLEARTSESDDRKYTQTIEHLNLRAATYVWQPWFIQLSGSLGLVAAQGRAAGDDVADRSSSSSNSVTGSLQVSVFAQSRFPFLATYARTDSRTGDSLASSDTLSQRLTLRQDYRSAIGDARYSLSYDRSELDSAAFGKDSVDVLTATMNRQFGDQSVDLIGTHSRNSRSIDSLKSVFTRLSAVHNYRLRDELAVNSVASMSRASTPQVADGDLVDAHQTFEQFSSFASWYPYTERPLTVNGGIRVAQSSQDAGPGGALDTRLANLNASAIYRATDNLSLSASASVQHASSGDQSTSISTQALGAGYTLDPRRWGEYLYNASANSSLTNVAGLPDGNRLSFGATISHGLQRQFPLSASMTLGASVAQSLAVARDGTGTDLRTLSHNAGLNLRYQSDGALSGFAGLSAGDSRTSGSIESSFQILNLQLSGQVAFSRYSTASANLTWQATRQESGTLDVSGQRTLLNGGVTYRHARLFGVPRLHYSAMLNAFDSQVSSRRLGDPDALAENVAWSAEQRLDYSIGRMAMRLTLRVSEVDGKKNALLFIRFVRQFGNF